MRGGRLLVVLLGLWLGACQEDPAPVSPPAPVVPEVPPFEEGGAVEFGEGQPGQLEPEPLAGIRPLRRLDIAQLDALILGVTEGLYWSETDAPGGDNLLEELAGTLGVPDYSVMTYEDLEPSLLFQKYLGDAARSVCWQLWEREREQEAGAPVVLLERAGPEDTWESSPERIDDNLRRLLLRFHGRGVSGDSARLLLWRWLFQSAYHVSSDAAVAWRTVCVGLITHPDFYLQ